MNEKKDSNSKPGSDPSLPSGASAADRPDENPWDDDGGGRTLAQEGPSFALPSNIPSPITVPPPPPPAAPAPAIAVPQVGRPAKPRSATMMGFGPPGPALPGQTGPGLPMGGGMGFTPAGGMPVAPLAPPPASSPALPASTDARKPFPVMPLGGGTVQGSPAPPSSPDLSAASAASQALVAGGPPSSNKRPPPLPPRPAGAAPPASFAATMASPGVSPSPGTGAGNAGKIGAPAAPAAPKPPAPAPVISSNPPPAADDDAWPVAAQQEDGPTMAVASPALTGRPLRDDLMNPRPGAGAPPAAPAPAAGSPAAPPPGSGRMMPNSSPMASTGYRPQGGVDKDADTMALASNSPLLPSLDASDGEVEETTRAVSREELMGHQDAQFVVGEDAMGDEATLAVAPGQIDLPHGGLAAALAESIRRESQPNMPGAPAFPPPPQGFQNQAPNGFNNSAPMGSSSGRLAAAAAAAPHSDPGQYPGMQPQAWGGDAAPWGGEQAPPWSQPQPMSGMQQQQQQQGYDPMMPGPPSNPGMPGGYPQSGQHQLMQQQQQQQQQGSQGYPMQGGQGGYPHPNAATAQQPYPMGGMQGGQMMPGQQAPWMQQQQQSPQPFGGLSRAATKFTPQVILLVAVGAVCLAIFIIGIVLFVTTKF